MGYTQEDFGKILGVTGKAVSKWERGLSCPDVSLLNQIAVELKVSIAQLMDGKADNVTLSSNSIQKNDDGSVRRHESHCHVELCQSMALGTVSPYLFGNNLEHTRSCVCGGISAQMLRNRKFVGKPSAMEGVAQEWYVIGEKTYCSFAEPYTHHVSEHYHMHRNVECNSQRISNYVQDEVSGIGQHELSVSACETYEVAVVLQAVLDMELMVQLTSRDGKKVYAGKKLFVQKGEAWERYVVTLTPTESDSDADFRITFDKKGCVTLGCVSLMNAKNFRGLRLDVIEAMKEIGIKLLRWPGGNFAGEYNWFDGLLPVDERAPFESYMNLETQPHTMGYDFHEINTDDFIALCREIGAEPYLTINLAWNTPAENAAWVEYCNGDETTEYGRIRAQRGNPKPYNVMLWSLGNEFGYGHMEGDNSTCGYARLARENGKRMLEICPNLTFCSSGPYPNREWADHSARPLSDISSMISFHFYNKEPQYADLSKLRAEYERCMGAVNRARNNLREIHDMVDGRVKISFDEWNVWYAWYRPSCVIDGVYTALMMHMIIGEAQTSGIALACQFEAVNESAIKVTKQGVSLTAAGQALALMKHHVNGILRFASDGVVATEKDGVTTITAVNASYDIPQKISFENKGKNVSAKLYEGTSLLPHSYFSIRDLVINTNGELFEFELPPHGMAMIQY